MVKIPENKTRKRLRLLLCTLYLFEIFLCTMPYIQGNTSDGKFYSYSVFDMISFWGGQIPRGRPFRHTHILCRYSLLFPLSDFSFARLIKNAI